MFCKISLFNYTDELYGWGLILPASNTLQFWRQEYAILADMLGKVVHQGRTCHPFIDNGKGIVFAHKWQYCL